jgi:hypothetical protein
MCNKTYAFTFGEMIAGCVVCWILGMMLGIASLNDYAKISENAIGKTLTYKDVPYKLVPLQ